MGGGCYEAEMQITEMSNLVSCSYPINDKHVPSQRLLCKPPHQDKYFTGTRTHPSFDSYLNQVRLCSSTTFCNVVCKTKNLGCYKPLGRRLKATQQGQLIDPLLIQASLDNEFRSSRNIAISLHRRYRNVIERGCGENLREFIKAGVTAYAVGCTEEGLRKELLSIKSSYAEEGEMPKHGSSTGLKCKITAEEIEECILWLSIVFITILCTPQPTIVRWSRSPPVSAEVKLQWKGFCALIANAYYIRGMAWLPVKTLQLEQMAVTGTAEEPAIVAGRMRLVFATLEVVSPQWPRV